MTKKRGFRHVVLALILAACGGTVGKRTAGGESHFLQTCEESCDVGLECVSGLCTRSCLVGGSECTDLAPRAACTNRSIEPGEVAVCDLACDRDRDCTTLGSDFRCAAGFCRIGSPAKQPPSNPPAMPSGGSGGSGGGFVPFAPKCDSDPGVQSECSFEATCAELHCGDGFSQFDKNGCTRYCAADTDCGAGERCRFTILAITEDDCPSIGSEVESCELSDDECYCSVTADCTRPSICVDAEAYPETHDCTVDGASCAQLAETRFAIETFAERDDGSAISEKAARCLTAVDAKRFELACVSRPTDSFAPACAKPLNFKSSCNFEDTCEQLGCGDGLSQFDARGCTRYCEISADCGAGERCRHTSLLLSEEECLSPGSEVEACSVVDGGCECSFTADCPYPDICIDATQYPESLDCAVDGASCRVLATGEAQRQEILQNSPTTEEANVAQTCLDAIHAAQRALACAE